VESNHIEKRLMKLEESLEKKHTQNAKEIQDIKKLLNQGQGAVKVLVFLGGMVGFFLMIVEAVKGGLFSS